MVFTDLEDVLSTARKDEAVAYMAEHPEDVEPALIWATSDHPCHNWRAAWLLTHGITPNDSRVRPFIGGFLQCLSNTSDQHARELLKILLKMELDDEQEGTLFNRVIAIWEDTDRKPAVRFYAIKIILNMVIKYPDLSNEVRALIQPHYLSPLTSGIRASVVRHIRRTLPPT